MTQLVNEERFKELQDAFDDFAINNWWYKFFIAVFAYGICSAIVFVSLGLSYSYMVDGVMKELPKICRMLALSSQGM